MCVEPQRIQAEGAVAQSQTATGMMNTGGNVAGGIGAVLVPVIAGSFGWTAAVASGAVFSIVGAALWLGIRADLPLQTRMVSFPAIVRPAVESA